MALRTEEERVEVRYRRTVRMTRRYWARLGVTLFVCWHLLAIFIWTMPQLKVMYPVMGQWVRAYMTTTGFNQGWTMFAPNPYATDVFVECHIHYSDGTTRSWRYTYMPDLDYWTRYQKERWRKYVEVANLDQYKFLWPTMGRYAARVNNIYPNNPPTMVDMLTHKHTVPPPDGDGTKSPWQTFQFTSVPITVEDLK